MGAAPFLGVYWLPTLSKDGDGGEDRSDVPAADMAALIDGCDPCLGVMVGEDATGGGGADAINGDMAGMVVEFEDIGGAGEADGTAGPDGCGTEDLEKRDGALADALAVVEPAPGTRARTASIRLITPSIPSISMSAIADCERSSGSRGP